jgi:hypothetical protein
VLFQFDPFAFIASIAAGLALRRGSNVIMGIRLSGQLSGPKPWDARGEATFSILFFDVTISFHETWGDEPDAIAAGTEDLTQRLTAELDSDRNWTADPPRASSLFVTIKKVDPSGAIVVHPFGVLTFSQRLLPLEVTLDKFGERAPKDANRFTIAPSDASVRSEPLDELFAPANFFDLEDTDKLARPSFEPMRGGFRITGAGSLQAPAMVSKSVDYELTYVRRKKRGIRLYAGLYRYAKDLFQVSLRGSTVAKSPLSFVSTRPSVNGPDEVLLPPEGFAIVSTRDMSLHATAPLSSSYTAASQQLDGLVTANPELAGTLQVVSTYELSAS